MPIFLKLFLLLSLLRAFLAAEPLRDRPLLLATIYGVGAGLFESFFWPGWLRWGLLTGYSFLVAWAYFWLLAALEDAGIVWWIVILAGVTLLLGVPLAVLR